MEQIQIKGAVRRVRARLITLFLVKWLTLGLVVSVFTGSLLLLVSRWLVVANYRWWIGGLVLTMFLAFALIVWLRRPTWQDAVRYIDEPTENRVSTALKYAGDESVIATLQRQETVQVASTFVAKLRSKLPLTLPRRWGLVLVSLLVSFIVLWVLPSPADEVLAQREREEQWIVEQAEKVAELLEEQNSQPKQENILPAVKEVRKELLAELEAIFHELQQQEMALDALERLEQMLQVMDERMMEIEKERVATEQASAASEGGSLAEENVGSAAERAGQLAELQRQVEELARALAEMGIPAAMEWAQQGRPVSDVWRDGGLASELAQLPQGSTEATGSDSSQGSVAGNANEPGSGTSGQGEGTGPGSGSSTEGAGTGGQSEEGNGPGQSGQGPGSQSAGGGQGGLQGGTGSGDRNMVSTPRKFAGESEAEVDGGPVSGEGGETEHIGNGPAEAGTAAPYERVYGAYEQDARQSVERSPVPDSLKQIVKDYFTTISPSS